MQPKALMHGHRCIWLPIVVSVNPKIHLKTINLNDDNPPTQFHFLPLKCVSYVNAGEVDVANVLIENGADLNAKDFHGKTPLFLAVYNCSNILSTICFD